MGGRECRYIQEKEGRDSKDWLVDCFDLGISRRSFGDLWFGVSRKKGVKFGVLCGIGIRIVLCWLYKLKIWLCETSCRWLCTRGPVPWH
jgi:hypothetical protein